MKALDIYSQKFKRIHVSPGHNKLVVADIIWRESEAVKSTAWMEVAWHAIAAVCVLADALHLSCLMEVCATDGLSDLPDAIAVLVKPPAKPPFLLQQALDMV